jgi:hypothetical protein
MKEKIFSLLLGVAVCATPAWASGNKASINKIEHQEQVRIHQGIRSGELTRSEARRLEAEQARIRVDERFARDGKFTVKERQHLYNELHRASHDIYHQKHDNQDRN